MRDERVKAFTVGIAAALVCSVLVSAAVVMLRPFQAASREKERVDTIVISAGLDVKDADENFKLFRPVMVDLQTGDYIEDADEADWYAGYSQMLRDPARNTSLSKRDDIASIRTVPNKMLVYVLYANGKPVSAALPVYGAGLWSTMRAYIGIKLDDYTVTGLRFYEHGETPGLGGEIDNPKWQAQWNGKEAFNSKLMPSIYIGRGGYAKGGVDSLSGATLTTDGVRNMMNFWLGGHGYGPFLAKIHEAAL